MISLKIFWPVSSTPLWCLGPLQASTVAPGQFILCHYLSRSAVPRSRDGFHLRGQNPMQQPVLGPGFSISFIRHCISISFLGHLIPSLATSGPPFCFLAILWPSLPPSSRQGMMICSTWDCLIKVFSAPRGQRAFLLYLHHTLSMQHRNRYTMDAYNVFVR